MNIESFSLLVDLRGPQVGKKKRNFRGVMPAEEILLPSRDGSGEMFP
jgi:hypothetical protein